MQKKDVIEGAMKIMVVSRRQSNTPLNFILDIPSVTVSALGTFDKSHGSDAVCTLSGGL